MTSSRKKTDAGFAVLADLLIDRTHYVIRGSAEHREVYERERLGIQFDKAVLVDGKEWEYAVNNHCASFIFDDDEWDDD